MLHTIIKYNVRQKKKNVRQKNKYRSKRLNVNTSILHCYPSCVVVQALSLDCKQKPHRRLEEGRKTHELEMFTAAPAANGTTYESCFSTFKRPPFQTNTHAHASTSMHTKTSLMK